MSEKPGQGQQSESVGYCNPPQGTRFREGQSGNPAGRPKGSFNINTALMRILSEPVLIKENGKPKSVTRLEAMIAKLINKGVSGNLKATQIVSAMLRSAEEQQNESERPAILSASDQEILREAMRRRLKMPVEIEIIRDRRPSHTGGGRLTHPVPLGSGCESSVTVRPGESDESQQR